MTTQAGGATGTSRRLRADAERNRLRIIAAARRLFAERGLEVSLDDVADAAGVGVGTVYRRFANRDQLIVGIFAQHLEDVLDELDDEALDDLDPWSTLVTCATTICTAIAEDRGLAAIMIEIDHTDPQIEAIKSRLTELMRRVFDRAHAAEVIRPDIADTDFFAIFAMISAVADTTQATAPGTWRRYLELLLDSIHTGGERLALTMPPLTEAQIRAIQQYKHGRRCGGTGS